MRCGADERKSLEQLSRTITRPALANERVQCNAAGQVVLKLKTPWHDDTTHLVMSPLEVMQRLDCTGQLPPSFVEYALRDGAAGVLVSGCKPGGCEFRLGTRWTEERLLGLRLWASAASVHRAALLRRDQHAGFGGNVVVRNVRGAAPCAQREAA